MISSQGTSIPSSQRPSLPSPHGQSKPGNKLGKKISAVYSRYIADNVYETTTAALKMASQAALSYAIVLSPLLHEQFDFSWPSIAISLLFCAPMHRIAQLIAKGQSTAFSLRSVDQFEPPLIRIENQKDRLHSFYRRLTDGPIALASLDTVYLRDRSETHVNNPAINHEATHLLGGGEVQAWNIGAATTVRAVMQQAFAGNCRTTYLEYLMHLLVPTMFRNITAIAYAIDGVNIYEDLNCYRTAPKDLLRQWAIGRLDLSDIELAVVLFRADKFRLAIKIFQNCLIKEELEPAEANYFIARCHEQLGELEMARVAYNKAVQGDKSLPEVILAREHLARLDLLSANPS